MERSVEVTRLVQAIEQFEQRKPRNMPEGFDESLASFKSALTGDVPGQENTPGSRAAREVAGRGTDGTGEHYSRAARGSDQPSPGQREAASVSGDIEQAAASIREKVKANQKEKEGAAAQ